MDDSLTELRSSLAGAVIGLVALYLRAPVASRSRWVDAGLAALVAGLFCGRLGYVFVHGSYYAGQPGEALAVWLGGLSWPSAAAGLSKIPIETSKKSALVL